MWVLAVMVGCGVDDSGADPSTVALPTQGVWRPASFLDEADDCGFSDLSVDVASLLPELYRVRSVDEASRSFRLATPEFDLVTLCTVDAPGTFACESARGGLPSDFGSDDEITLATTWSGTATEDRLEGDVTIELTCTAPPDKCAQFAAAGLTFPCALTGVLVLEPEVAEDP